MNEPQIPQARPVDLVIADLGRSLGEKAVEVSNWKVQAQIFEVQLTEARERIRELEVLAGALEAQVSEQQRDDVKSPGDVEEDESPTKG